jgi:hypothetical protein
MNPVIGLDISKEESHGQFLERGKPYRGTFHFEHTREGLAKLLQVVQDVEHASCQPPMLRWLLQALTLVSSLQVSLQQPGIELLNVVPGNFDMR